MLAFCRMVFAAPIHCLRVLSAADISLSFDAPRRDANGSAVVAALAQPGQEGREQRIYLIAGNV